MSLASRGLRDMDTGREAITDAAELAQVRRQAMKVRLQGVVVGLVLTALGLAIPS